MGRQEIAWGEATTDWLGVANLGARVKKVTKQNVEGLWSGEDSVSPLMAREAVHCSDFLPLPET